MRNEVTRRDSLAGAAAAGFGSTWAGKRALAGIIDGAGDWFRRAGCDEFDLDFFIAEDLRQVKLSRDWRGGTFPTTGQETFLAFDLGAGNTTLSAISLKGRSYEQTDDIIPT